MKYGSVCSGVEAASVAWEPLGWEPVFFSEIEPFPSAVLAHHWPDVPNYGDTTEFMSWPFKKIDVLVGGTPCQSFSIVGLRKGLTDDRGNLSLTYMRMVDQLRPRWCVWENVPGVLSSNGGRDFGSIVGALAELGYSCCWRVLDAQNFGVPQRRRRVFLVGCASGDWRDPASVLFEQSCGKRDFETVRKRKLRGRGREITGCLSTRSGAFDRQELDTLIYDYQNKTVRVSTPTEQERLQGFPDGHTDIPWNRDTRHLRYKAMGNSMAVPVMRWIGERIQAHERGHG